LITYVQGCVNVQKTRERRFRLILILSLAMFQELKAQLKICVPVCTQNLMKRSVDVITLMTVGHLGPHAMSAAGLATVTSNVFGNSFIMGLVRFLFWCIHK
jgi:Na+-driven multidrug efflux pump